MFLSIIIPCYNESKRIGATLDKIGTYLEEEAYDYEIIIVDNGSTDKTMSIALNRKKAIPNLRIVMQKSRGKGWAVMQGMLEAQGDYRLFIDADNSTDIRQLKNLLEFAERGCDVVIGSRKTTGALISRPQQKYRVFLSGLFTFIANLIIPLGIKDTQNGFKLFSREAAENIFPRLTTFYWAFDVEVLALATKFGFKIKEVPIAG